MTYQELGQFIKQERKKLKLTQKELADLAEVSRRTLQYIEAGQHFHIQTLTQVLKALGYSLELEMKVEKIKA